MDFFVCLYLKKMLNFRYLLGYYDWYTKVVNMPPVPSVKLLDT